MLSANRCKRFFATAKHLLKQTIVNNRRQDSLFHAYNLLRWEGEQLHVDHLDEMLEGQVAVLSSGYLNPEESLKVLDALKASALFRDDQYSYLLYPSKKLPGFMEKNIIPASSVEKSELLSALLRDNNDRLVNQDITGSYHFNGNFKNAQDVEKALSDLEEMGYANTVRKEREFVLQIVEQVFDHKSFTGRSGTFYGYEGLGSIYWHMVSKLLLAVQEVCLEAVAAKESEKTIGKLLEHYYEINAGLGVHKSPKLYGAFPTDPYSHTPAGKGAQQPGMTGQVKEDVLCRFGELGAFVNHGKLYFDPCLLQKSEFIIKPRIFEYVDIDKQHRSIELETGSLAFTYCQVLVVYRLADDQKMRIEFNDGTNTLSDTLVIDAQTSAEIFNRTGKVGKITVHVDSAVLK